jgi:hypothetical protein
MGRSAAVRVSLVSLLLYVVAGCALGNAAATQVPLVTIENDSGRPVDIFSFSHRNGATIKQTTLVDGGVFGSEPAGARCEEDISYLVVAAGRQVATLDRPGCTGGTLVVTPRMLLEPDASTTDEPS